MARFSASETGANFFCSLFFKDKANFQVEFLNDLVSQLEKGYNIVPIDNRIYNCLSEEEWSQDFTGGF